MRWFVGMATMLLLLTGCAVIGEGQLITTPVNGERVRGVVLISVSPPTGVIVDRVEFFVDGRLIRVVNAPGPYTCQWDTTQITNGTYRLSVTVFSVDGHTQSETIEVQVAN